MNPRIDSFGLVAHNLLLQLAKEQRVEQFADKKILVHPANFNRGKLVEDFNSRIEGASVDSCILNTRMSKYDIYTNSTYDEWKDEILFEVQNRQRAGIPIAPFVHYRTFESAPLVRWTEEEMKVGNKIVQENKNEMQRVVVDKIAAVLSNRSTVAIRVRIVCSF